MSVDAYDVSSEIMAELALGTGFTVHIQLARAAQGREERPQASLIAAKPPPSLIFEPPAGRPWRALAQTLAHAAARSLTGHAVADQSTTARSLGCEVSWSSLFTWSRTLWKKAPRDWDDPLRSSVSEVHVTVAVVGPTGVTERVASMAPTAPAGSGA